MSAKEGAAETVWFVLDDAWEFDEPPSFELPMRVEALGSGPSLRYISSQRVIDRFYAEFGEAFRRLIAGRLGLQEAAEGEGLSAQALADAVVRKQVAQLVAENARATRLQHDYWQVGVNLMFHLSAGLGLNG